MSAARHRVMSSNHAGLVLHNMKQLCYIATLRSIPHHVTCMTSSSASGDGHVMLGTQDNGCLVYSLAAPDDGFLGRIGKQPPVKSGASNSKSSQGGTTIHSLAATDDKLVYIQEEEGKVSLCVHNLEDVFKGEEPPIISTRLSRPAPMVVDPKLELVVIGAVAWKESWTSSSTPAPPVAVKETKTTTNTKKGSPKPTSASSKSGSAKSSTKSTKTSNKLDTKRPSSSSSTKSSSSKTSSKTSTTAKTSSKASSPSVKRTSPTASTLASTATADADLSAINGEEEKWLRVLDMSDLSVTREFKVVENSVSLLRVQVTENGNMLGVSDTRTGLKVYNLQKPTDDGAYMCLYNVPVEEVRNFEIVGDFIGVFHKFEPNVSFWNMSEQKTILCINIQDQMKQLALDYYQDEDDDDSGLFDDNDDQVTAVCAVTFQNDHILIYGTKAGCIFGMSVETRTKLFSIPFPHDCENDQRVRKDIVALDLIDGDKLVVCFEGHGLTVLDFGKRDAPHRPPTRGQQK